MQSNNATPVNVPEILEFLGESWEFYMYDGDYTVFKYLDNDRPIYERQEFIEEFPNLEYELWSKGIEGGWLWTVKICHVSKKIILAF